MPPLDKPRLRRALRALQSIPASPDDAAIVAQESLDFLAMLAGLKPVYVLGRGYDDRAWSGSVRDLATAQRLHVVDGPAWRSEESLSGLPEWYAADTRAALQSVRVTYVCKARATHAAVEHACATGAPTIAEEARLLGFPECCAAAQHARFRIYHDMTLAILERRANGDAARMQELLEAQDEPKPETDSELAQFAKATGIIPAPFTSLNLCESCAASPASPGMRLAKRYGDLAAAIDPDYFWVLST